MLHQPRRWLPGLLPLALLAGGSLWWKQDAIETDLSARATRAIGAASTVDGICTDVPDRSHPRPEHNTDDG